MDLYSGGRREWAQGVGAGSGRREWVQGGGCNTPNSAKFLEIRAFENCYSVVKG